MILKSIISSWEGTISCKIWNQKNQIHYFNVKASQDYCLIKRSTDFKVLGVLVRKIKQSGTRVSWYREWLSRAISHVCDTTLTQWTKYFGDCWKTLQWEQTWYPGATQTHTQCLLPRRQHYFHPRPVLAPIYCSVHWIVFAVSIWPVLGSVTML